MTAHMTNEQCQLARRLQALGKSLRDIARELGVSSVDFHVMLRDPRRDPRPDAWTPAQGRLNMAERRRRLGAAT